MCVRTNKRTNEFDNFIAMLRLRMNTKNAITNRYKYKFPFFHFVHSFDGGCFFATFALYWHVSWLLLVQWKSMVRSECESCRELKWTMTIYICCTCIGCTSDAIHLLHLEYERQNAIPEWQWMAQLGKINFSASLSFSFAFQIVSNRLFCFHLFDTMKMENKTVRRQWKGAKTNGRWRSAANRVQARMV